jgi:hypothetical protein
MTERCTLSDTCCAALSEYAKLLASSEEPSFAHLAFTCDVYCAYIQRDPLWIQANKQGLPEDDLTLLATAFSYYAEDHEEVALSLNLLSSELLPLNETAGGCTSK